MPAIAFYSGHPPSEVTNSGQQWHLPLPLDRYADGQGRITAADLTYGRYFQAVENFLLENGIKIITSTAGRRLYPKADATNIHRIDVHLIKHGAFYHPAKVIARLENAAVPMILNVAASVEGRKTLPGEYRNLQRLSRAYPDQRLIDVYGWGTARTGYQQEELLMFLGQWLEGYYEFHMTSGQDKCARWEIWDTDHGARNLATIEVNELFRQAATIMAAYYNPLTFEAILDWHHAAGDFIIRPTGTGIDTRLITVRRYEPLIQWNEPEPPSVQDILEAITLFILRTSLFLRLDRLDGVGALAWASVDILPAIIHGLSDGLTITADRNGIPQTVVEAAWAFFSAHSKTELIDMGMNIINKRQAVVTEKTFIAGNLEAHIDELRNIL